MSPQIRSMMGENHLSVRERNCSELGRSRGFLTPYGEAAKYETVRVIQPDPLKREQLHPIRRKPTRRNSLSIATIEKNDVHNYRTADMSDALGHGVHSAIDSLETARSMAHALAEALPDDPDDKVDPDRVRELTSRTLDAWREVKILAAGGEPVAEPFMEQIDLEVLALTLDADDPERLERTAASAVEAAGKLLSFHAQALLNSRLVAAA